MGEWRWAGAPTACPKARGPPPLLEYDEDVLVDLALLHEHYLLLDSGTGDFRPHIREHEGMRTVVLVI